jgi:hypothetical protein
MAKANFTTEIRDYEFFKTDILTPEDYVKICEEYDDMDGYRYGEDSSSEDLEELQYNSGDHPSYARVYKTLRRKCAKQQHIIKTKRDSKLMKLAFQQFFNLKDMVLVFGLTQEGQCSERDYEDIYDAAELTSYQSSEHHIRSVLAVLDSFPRHHIRFREIQLTGLTSPIGRPISPDDPHWKPLTILLTGLMSHAPCLQLVDSDLVLALFPRKSLNIRELILCSTYTEIRLITNFLQSNAKTLRSLSIHNQDGTERNQGAFGYLTPAHVAGIKELRIESKEKVHAGSCPCSCWVQEGWKFYFDLVSVPNTRKRKRSNT